MTDGLEQYLGKRDLDKSGEPGAAPRERSGPLTFVVQKHRASRLHYDLRLEVDGVLKSWAVPKGPSLDPAQKRLAAIVEDHPFDYASFEGTIPGGEYGAGEVIVWDNGTYSPDEAGKFLFTDRAAAQAEMRHGLEAGKISFYLRGHKMKGSWTLVKVRSREKDWLLIKHQDEFARADRDILDDDGSVLSGRTIADVKEGKLETAPALSTLNLAETPGARPAPFPGFVPPMLASLAEAPFSHPEWVFEPKLDGYRIIAGVRHGAPTLWSRRGANVTGKYPLLMPALGRQPASELVLDGEMVALDAAGRVSFERLQQYLQPGSLQGGPAIPVVYYVFDILFLDGYDLTGVPWRARKSLLSATLREAGGVRLVESFEADGRAVFEASVKNGLEGIVAKKAGGLYQSGRRSQEWLKVKSVQTGDFIVAGYTAGDGNRAGSMGSLLLGYLDDRNKLVYAGNVGSGFTEETLSRVKDRLDRIRSDRSPFPPEPPAPTPPVWVRPEVVVEVKYGQWTRDGRLRAPVFVRLRDDKPADGVTRPEAGVGPPEGGARPPEVVRTRHSPDGRDPPEATVGPPEGGAQPPEVVPTPHRAARRDQPPADAGLVAQLAGGKGSFEIDVEGSPLNVTNVDKVLWPATTGHPPLTKRHFLTYLAQVAPFLLPHLKDRPLTLSRYPDGIHGQHFWQKHWGHPVPPFVRTVSIAEDSGKEGEYLICDNLATLMWLGQVADIEFHTWYSRTGRDPEMIDQAAGAGVPLDYPDFIVFDLDPYIYSGKEKAGDEPELNRVAFNRVCEVAVWLKEVLDGLSLTAFVKTSGKTGLHVYLPVVRNLEFGSARRAAETVGQFLMQRHPQDITMEWATEKRTGKVFIDYAQNVRGKTLASVYSPRPAPDATVSFPLRWEDLGKVYPGDFTMLTVPGLLGERGDLWKDILGAKRDLGDLLAKGTP